MHEILNSMGIRRHPMPRLMLNKNNCAENLNAVPSSLSQIIRMTNIDFSISGLPNNICVLFAEAFWSHFGVLSDNSKITAWGNLKVFFRFQLEKKLINSLSDFNGDFLLKYIEWLNFQINSNNKSWSKSSQSAAYGVIRTILRWIECFKPNLLKKIVYPINPFPWRNRDTPEMDKIPAKMLRDIIRACEKEISDMRNRRKNADLQKQQYDLKNGSLGWLLKLIEKDFGGIFPAVHSNPKDCKYNIPRIVSKLGGLSNLEPLLYPNSASLLPYYILILIHSAANPEPIASIKRDCIQNIPMLEDRLALVWYKARSNSMQRRTFSANDSFEPPYLVAEIIQWNKILVPLALPAIQDNLFIFKGMRGITSLSCGVVKYLVKEFCQRYNIPRFSLASVRPSVLTSFYRASGDLRNVKNIANHAHISTTVRYVESPLVQEKNRQQIVSMQNAFIANLEKQELETVVLKVDTLKIHPEPAVSMFGFDCKDPFAGVAPGSHPGKLCGQFMGCFTCPNSIITSDPPLLAKLLQARNHLRDAAIYLHPARWAAIYAPKLKILEMDVLTRFSEVEISIASQLIDELPPLPELR